MYSGDDHDSDSCPSGRRVDILCVLPLEVMFL